MSFLFFCSSLPKCIYNCLNSEHFIHFRGKLRHCTEFFHTTPGSMSTVVTFSLYPYASLHYTLFHNLSIIFSRKKGSGGKYIRSNQEGYIHAWITKASTGSLSSTFILCAQSPWPSSPNLTSKAHTISSAFGRLMNRKDSLAPTINT